MEWQGNSLWLFSASSSSPSLSHQRKPYKTIPQCSPQLKWQTCRHVPTRGQIFQHCNPFGELPRREFLCRRPGRRSRTTHVSPGAKHAKISATTPAGERRERRGVFQRAGQAGGARFESTCVRDNICVVEGRKRLVGMGDGLDGKGTRSFACGCCVFGKRAREGVGLDGLEGVATDH